MKKTKYFAWLIAAGMAMSGCSDEMDGPGTENTVEGVDGYVKVAINLPTTSGFSTRANDEGLENDEFAYGEGYEYSVTDGIIAFFTAPTSESDPDAKATFVKAYNLTSADFPEWSKPVSGNEEANVTTKSLLITEAPKPKDNYEVYALVILNKNEHIAVTTDNMLTIQGTTLSTSSTLSALQNAIVVSASDMIGGSSKNKFLMTSSPISNIPSANPNTFDPKVTTLTRVEVYDIMPTEADDLPAEQIYVERAVAKVEVAVTGTESNKPNISDGSAILKVTGHDDHSVIFKKWKLNITNKTTKLVRDVSDYTIWKGYKNQDLAGAGTGTQTNRFFGTTPDPYRIYWAVDCNYDAPDALTNSAYQSTNFNTLVNETSTANWNPMYSSDKKTSIEYCLENTMIANQMVQGLTTGVVIEATYQIDGNEGGHLFTMGNSSAIYGVDELTKRINAYLGIKEDANKYVFVPGTGTDGATIDDATDFATYFKKNGSTDMTAEDAKKLLENTDVKAIKFYRGGKTYYWSKPIKHFGDYYTPIVEDNEIVPSVSNSDEYDNGKHLGRYGVVRNNWYEINIASVAGPGYPEIPDIPVDPENPDDSEEGYININVNVLSWATRVQDVNL